MRSSSSTSSKRAPWDERGARLHHQLGRKEEDLALFQDMRIRESSTNCSPSTLNPSSPLDHLHSSGKFRGAPLGRNDLLTSEMDKSDYDWLLTPPGTPLFPSLDRDYLIPSPSSNSNNNNSSSNPRDSTSASSASRKLSRLSTPTQQLLVSSSSSGSSAGSASKLYTGPGSRGSNPSPARRQSAPLPASTSTTPSSGIKQRPAPGTTPTTTGSRPSTPTRRPSSAPSPSTVAAPRRASTPTRNPSRPATPTRTSPTLSSSSASGPARPSTPTRRPSNPISPATSSVSSSSFSNGRVPSSRGTSPVRRPAAADRSPSTNCSSSGSFGSSGAVTGTTHHHLTRSFNHQLERGGAGGEHHHHQGVSFSRRAVTSANDLQLPKSEPVKKAAAKYCAGSRETSFFGTSISKKSIDTAIRHMDIRRSSPGGFKAPPPAATVTYPKSTRSQVLHQQQNNHANHQQSNNNHQYYQQHQELPDYSRLMNSGEDKPVNGLFEHVQDAMDDSFLLEFNSLTASSEATFLEGADYLKDP